MVEKNEHAVPERGQTRMIATNVLAYSSLQCTAVSPKSLQNQPENESRARRNYLEFILGWNNIFAQFWETIRIGVVADGWAFYFALKKYLVYLFIRRVLTMSLGRKNDLM